MNAQHTCSLLAAALHPALPDPLLAQTPTPAPAARRPAAAAAGPQDDRRADQHGGIRRR